MVSLVYAWRPHAQQAVQQVPGTAGRSAALPVAAQGDNDVKDMGGTFYFLEGRAKRVTTRFADAVAIAERGLDGSIKTRSTDLAGNEVGRLTVDHVSARDSGMFYESNGAPLFYMPVRSEVRPTLDWATLQAHALRRDGHPSTVQWQGRFARSRAFKAGNLDDQADEVATEFEQDIVAKTIRVVPKPGENKRVSTLTRIYDRGVEVGQIAWVPSEKLLIWDFKGLVKGAVNEETLKTAGGWTFRPTMAWANVQGLAFYTFHSKLKKDGTGSIARNPSEHKNWLQKLSEVVVQPISADTGCDPGAMHYLDGTMFRSCCDRHDLCYARNVGCSGWSWWYPPRWRWECTACNAVAAVCFYSVSALTTGTCIYMPGACR